METKLSAIVREIPKHYEQMQGELYRKGDNGKPCKVCAMGGIALLCAPNKYKPFDESTVGLTVQNLGRRLSPVDYDGILKDAGITDENVLRRSMENAYVARFKDVDGNERIATNTDLAFFIFHMNDKGATFEQIAEALEKYNL